MPKFIVWRLWSIYFDHHLPLLKPSKKNGGSKVVHLIYDFEGDIRWCYWFDFGKLFEVVHVKVIINFLNGILYISLYILIAYLENFPKHYNYHFVKYLLSYKVWKSYSITGALALCNVPDRRLKSLVYNHVLQSWITFVELKIIGGCIFYFHFYIKNLFLYKNKTKKNNVIQCELDLDKLFRTWFWTIFKRF